MISACVYFLCAGTSTLCTVLLWLNYRRSGSRLLLWTALGFLGLALNNMLLVVDLVLTPPTFNLSVIRTIPAVLGMAVLLWGFVWDSP